MATSLAAVELRCFGRPCVVRRGELIALRPERHHRLLTFLAVSGDWHDRADLASLLWPVRRRELAQASLRKAVLLARALDWAGALETTARAVRFRVDCDVAAFDAAVREGRLADALAMRRGQLLDGFDDDANAAWSDWLAAERARIGGRWQELARTRLGQLHGSPHERAALASELLAIDPLDEEAVLALMQSQRLLGRPAEEAETYRQYAAELARETGAQPSARLREHHAEAASAATSASGDAFVGRARELDELAGLFARSECRLLTVMGPGGVGKSRLVKEALRRLAPRFDSVLWIAMDDLANAAQVVARLAATLGATPGPQQDPLDVVCAHAKLAQALVVLDNAEHVDGLPRVVERLLNESRGARVCATSRARLGVHGEWLLPLAGLAVPAAREPSGEQLLPDAARLFIAAARAVRPDFDAAAEADAIGTLVRAVDGLPLAILLAANWVRLLPVAQIVAELERSLDVLEAADEGEERPEHRSVRATLEQSWRLLAEPEQAALKRLSVFVGTFPLAAAREVVDAPLPLFASLADRSLVAMHADGRLSLHPLVRQFAHERLAADARDAAARHAGWFHRFLGAMQRDYRASVPQRLERIEREIENCRVAWRWAIAEASSEALASSVPALMYYFELRGRAREGLELLREALPLVGTRTTPACSASIVAAIAHLQYRVYRNDEARDTAHRALALARASGNGVARQQALNVLGLCAWQAGRYDEARRYLERSSALARAEDDAQGLVVALGNLAVVEKSAGHYERARELMLDVLARQRELGDWVGVATRLNNLAHLHQARGEWNEARAFLEQGLAFVEAHGIAFIRTHLLVNLAHVAFFAGDHAEAERVARVTLDAARADANGSVEATALLLLVRLAARRRAFRDARTLVGEAIRSASACGLAGLKLDAVFCFAEVLAGEGETRDAAALMRYYIDRPEIEPGDRAVAQAELDRLRTDVSDARLPADLDSLLAGLAARAASDR